MSADPGFSKRLAVAIARAGIKKGELARAVGLTPLSLSRYLTGDRTPHRAVLVALAHALGTSVEWLAADQADDLANATVSREAEAPYTPDAVALTGLDADERNTVIRLLDALRSGDEEIRHHLIGQLKIIESAIKARRQQPRAEREDAL